MRKKTSPGPPAMMGEEGFEHIDMGDPSDELIALRKLAKAVLELDFGRSPALPWCIESFPKLNKAINYLKEKGYIDDKK